MSKKQIVDTSREAYESLNPESIRDIYKRILWALSQIGEGTWEDLAIVLKEKESRIWRRLKEMADMNLIYRTENKKLLSSGRRGYTWRKTLQTTPTIIDHSRKIQDISKLVQQLKLL